MGRESTAEAHVRAKTNTRLAPVPLHCLQPLHYGNRCDLFKWKSKPRKHPARSVSGVVRICSFLCLLALWIPNARADPVSELASFSVFDKVNLAQLSKGEYKTVRSGSSGNARYLSVQTAYVAPFPPAELLAKMRSWNPTRYPELKVYLHSDSATDFSRLQKAPDNSAVVYLASATAQRSSDLQLSAAEMKLLPGESFARYPGRKFCSGRVRRWKLGAASLR